MPSIPLACTVRGCGRPLEPAAGILRCSNRHAFDRARSGYVNLLQPQDRRSLRAGDSAEAVDARQQLLAAGIGREIVQGVATEAVTLAAGISEPVVVDIGTGTGELLEAIAGRAPILGVGIDLSVPAIERAARRLPALTWVVANADRRLPLLDARVDVLTSLYARRHPTESARVLSAAGYLVVAVPTDNDLQELRAAIGSEPSSAAARPGLQVLAEHESAFRLVHHVVLRESHHASRETLLLLLRGTYRGERRSMSARVEALEPMDVTLSAEVFVFTRR